MSANKAKGTRAESAVVAYLRDRGFIHAERRALNGAKDLGDVTGIPNVVIEVKNQNRHSFSEWLDEAEVERENAGADVGAAWVKRRGKGSAGDWFVVMTGETFASLLEDAGYGTKRPTPVEQVPGQLEVGDA